MAGEPLHGRLEPIAVLAGHSYAVPRLLEGLSGDDPELRARCCFLLGQIATPDVRQPLLEGLDDPDRTVRIFAGIGLARMGDDAGYRAALAACSGSRWWIRYWAVDALARLSRVPQGALADPDPLVAAMACDAVGGGWEPAAATITYSGPSEASLSDLLELFENYMIGETDWWWHAGHYEQIIRGHETIVWLDSSWLEGLTNAAYLYWSLGRDVEALATYRRAVATHPEAWESHFEMGFFYFNAQKRYGHAAREFAQARKLGAPPVQARMHGHALEKAGQIPEALEVWRELVAKNPGDLVARDNLRRVEALVDGGR
ncbi:MAG TPA: hypothetical protein DEP45_12340 [Armatimonadetes bacterium]|nr:hypothetical protein [Armatimonadota bacterium]